MDYGWKLAEFADAPSLRICVGCEIEGMGIGREAD